MAGKRRNMLKHLAFGDMRFAEFAVTNACVAKCSFCAIWRQQPKVFADLPGALRVIDNLAGMGVSHITLTGGEPLLHPGIVEMVSRCGARGVHCSILDAAPRLLTGERVAALDEAGADMISISLDSDDAAVLEESRRIPGIMADMEATVARVGRTRIKSMASILIWNGNHDRMERMFDRAVEMGFDLISVNYPTFSRSVVYPLGGDAISLPREQVADALRDVIRLKKSGRYRIVNSVTSMNNIVDYLTDHASARFPCFGGDRVMFVDWHFDVRPCMQLPDVLGNMLTMTRKDLSARECNACSMSWYRDFSVLFAGARSLPAWREVAREARAVL